MYGLDTKGRGLVHADCYWWHYKAFSEVDTICRENGHGATNAGAVAMNSGTTRQDAERYLREMIEWGWLEETEAQWDLPYPALWVKAVA